MVRPNSTGWLLFPIDGQVGGLSVAAMMAAGGFALSFGASLWLGMLSRGALRSKAEGKLTLGLMSGENQKHTPIPCRSRLAGDGVRPVNKYVG